MKTGPVIKLRVVSVAFSSFQEKPKRIRARQARQARLHATPNGPARAARCLRSLVYDWTAAFGRTFCDVLHAEGPYVRGASTIWL
jgi:hypothetical protein